MMLLQRTAEKAATEVAAVSRLEDLASIRQPGRAAVFWHRQVPAAFTHWIGNLTAEQLPSIRMELRPEDVSATLEEVFKDAALDDGTPRQWLMRDISAMATAFAGQMGASYLRLRLDVVTGNACWKFHIDAVTARLICTYRGAGTQYGIAHGGAEPRQISSVPTGAPLVIRGTLWPGDSPSGLVHRSPPIAGTGQTRLLLVLDPLAPPEKEWF